MKTIINRINVFRGLIGAVSVVLVPPVLAIEPPVVEDAPKVKEGRVAAAEEVPKAERKIAMLGLGGAPVSETLSTHLGLEEDCGLTIYHVVPGSAAAKAGFKAHDILIEFNGKKIGCQQDLRDAVLAQKPGDEVAVKLVQKGKTVEKKVILGERDEIPRVAPVPGINPNWFDQGFGNLPEANMKRIRQHLEEMQRQMGKNDGMDLQKLLDDARKGGADGVNLGMSVTLMDNDGSITMKTANGKKEVLVKDKDGKVVFEGPYHTEQDKAAVPDEIRERLDRLDFGEDGEGALRLQIGPGGMEDEDVE